MSARPIVFDRALGMRRGHVIAFDRELVTVQWADHSVSQIKANDFTTERYQLVLPTPVTRVTDKAN